MDIIGTPNNDMLSFQGNIEQLTVTLTNPYTGQVIELDEEKNINFAKYYGGSGFDTINMSSFGDAIFLENPENGEQTLFDIESIQGQAGGDVIIVASANIDYAAGILINGGADDDILWGNIGPDNINGLFGNDNIDGGDGDDLLNGFSGNDLIYGGRGDDTINGDVAIPVSSFSGNDVVHAGEGNDTVTGGFGDDILNGDEGNDDLKGEDGIDILRGGAGNDIIDGGNDNDILIGGTGGDDSDFISITQMDHVFTETLLFPSLVERTDIANLAPPGTENLGVLAGNLSVDVETTAKITFLESGAGYRNTLGFYNIAADGTIQHTEIAFSNVHRSVAAPGLEHTVTLPGQPDTDFGFFIIADGFRRENGYNNLDLNDPSNLSFVYRRGTGDERLARITDDADDIELVYSDGTRTQILDGRGVYHTHTRGGEGINLNADGAEHVVSGLVETGDTSKLRIGFEDLRNLGDADFNDVVFDLEIEGTTVSEIAVEDNDILIGGAGEDILYGGYGDDIMTGGSEADIFLFTALDFSVDTITDFELGITGDEINITDLLAGYDPLTEVIGDFVQLTSSNGDTVIAIDSDGGGDNFTDIAVIQGGIGGADLSDLLADGNIVIDQAIVI